MPQFRAQGKLGKLAREQGAKGFDRVENLLFD
jgi:hypothetical protein